MGTYIGWVGAVLLSVCALPQAVVCLRTGKSTGLSPIFLWMWFLGEVLSCLYIVGWLWSAPLVFNYGLNILLIGIMLKYKYWPRKNRE